MCIIIVKPMGKELPSKEILKNCFINNNDGAGFSFVKDNRIYLSKGYAKFKPFYRNVKQFIKEDTSAILHFRIASVGKVSDINCHPFVMTENKREVNKTVNCTKKPVFAHNGTLSIDATSGGRSDTIQYARIIGDPLIRNNMFRNNSLMKILKDSIGHSKMAFMNRKGDIKLLGDFEKDKGLFFSNFSYKYRYKGVVATYKGGKYVGGYNNHGWSGWERDDYGDPIFPILKDKKEDEKKEKVILLPDAKDVEKYPVTHTPCEVCLRDKGDGINYYPKIETNLCDNCYDLYYGYCEEEVEDDSNGSDPNKKRKEE